MGEATVCTHARAEMLADGHLWCPECGAIGYHDEWTPPSSKPSLIGRAVALLRRARESWGLPFAERVRLQNSIDELLSDIANGDDA